MSHEKHMAAGTCIQMEGGGGWLTQTAFQHNHPAVHGGHGTGSGDEVDIPGLGRPEVPSGGISGRI